VLTFECEDVGVEVNLVAINLNHHIPQTWDHGERPPLGELVPPLPAWADDACGIPELDPDIVMSVGEAHELELPDLPPRS